MPFILLVCLRRKLHPNKVLSQNCTPVPCRLGIWRETELVVVRPLLSSPQSQHEGWCTVVPHPLHGKKKCCSARLIYVSENLFLSIHFQCQISRKPLIVNSVQSYWPQIKQDSYTDSIHNIDLNGSYKIIKSEHVVMIYTDRN